MPFTAFKIVDCLGERSLRFKYSATPISTVINRAFFDPSSYGLDDALDFARIFFKCALRKAFRAVEVEKEIKKVLCRKRLDRLSFQQRQLGSCPSTQSLNPRTLISARGCLHLESAH